MRAIRPIPQPVPLTNLQGAREYAYAPATGIESRWHPYLLDWTAQDAPAYVQWGLADYSLQVPRPMPHPDAEVLKGDPPDTIHKIATSAMAQGGIELERRWQLAATLPVGPSSGSSGNAARCAIRRRGPSASTSWRRAFLPLMPDQAGLT